MCGLVGVMKKNMSVMYIQRFAELMAVAQLRGNDGAGIISVPNGQFGSEVPHVNCRKTTWSSGHLVTLKEFDDVVKGDRSILIGHARQPTRGGSTIDNVHPHKHKDIIMVHNGTMSHVAGKQVPQGASDSKMIAQCLSEHGVNEFVQNSYGAYALVWVDLAKQTLNFIRNGERTLWMCEEKFSSQENSNTDAVFWASESNFLHLVLSRYASYSKERHVYYPLPANEHWEFPLNVGHLIQKPVVTKCEKKCVSKAATHWGGYGMYGSEYGYSEEEDWKAYFKEKDEAEAKEAKDKAPFETGVGSAVGPVAKPTTSASRADFSYTPPEHRQRDGISVAMMLVDSKSTAMSNARKNDTAVGKDPAQKALTFQPVAELDNFVCTDVGRIRQLVSGTACVWCSEKPLWRDGKPPRIYPVKFTETRGEYICDNCVPDLDVQRMLGIG